MDDEPSTRLAWPRGIAVPALAGALVVVLALTVGTTSVRPGSSALRVGAGASSSPSPTAASVASPPSGESRADALRLSLAEPSAAWHEGDADPDLTAVQLLLDRRARAAVAGDVQGYVATGLVDSIVRPQAESIAALPVASWSYAFNDAGGTSPSIPNETAVARETYGPDAYVLRTTLRYQLRGYDRTPVTTQHAVTVAFQGGDWEIINDVPVDGSKELWDFGGIHVVSGTRSLVVGLGTVAPSSATLESYAATADRDVTDVTSVWGKDWQRQVLVVAPPTVAAMASALGRPAADYRQIAAVTTADHGGATTISHGDRVFVNPKAFAKLGLRGRTIVLRHEITHVASLAAADDSMPTWMEEGFADYVGYGGSGVPTATILRELSDWVASGARPRSLPSDSDYDGDNPHLVEAYEQSWLAAHMIADTYGRARLVELYRAMRVSTTANPAGGTDEAFRSVLGISFAAFTRQWRAQVRALGASGA